MSTMDHKETDLVNEKHVENRRESRKGSLSNLEIEALGGLRTVEIGLGADEVIETVEVEAAERKRILRKVDYRLVPLLAFLYL